jgi:lipoate-protein ligase A
VTTCATFIAAPTAWKLRVDGPQPGQANMDEDALLLEDQSLPDALPTLRFFRWQEPTISYGRLQKTEWVNSVAKAFHVGLSVNVAVHDLKTVQRPTGGGMVWHDKDLSFSISWRRDHPSFPKCLKEVYRTIHQSVAEALARRGIETSFYFYVKQSSAKTPTGICFIEPAEDDLIWNKKKILGGALRVTGWGRLYQGNILTEPLNISADELIPLISQTFEQTFQNPPKL